MSKNELEDNQEQPVPSPLDEGIINKEATSIQESAAQERPSSVDLQSTASPQGEAKESTVIPSEVEESPRENAKTGEEPSVASQDDSKEPSLDFSLPPFNAKHSKGEMSKSQDETKGVEEENDSMERTPSVTANAVPAPPLALSGESGRQDSLQPSPQWEATSEPSPQGKGDRRTAVDEAQENAEATSEETNPLPSPRGEGVTAEAVTDEGCTAPVEVTESTAETEPPLISQPAADSFPPGGSQENAEDAKNKTTPSSIVFVVLSCVLFAMAAFIFITSVVAKINGTQPEFFGYSFSIVLTDSMTPEIEVGELVVVKRCDISEVAKAYNEDGEKLNIVFISRSGTLEGERIVHKVYSVEIDEDGVISIQTKGEKEGAPVDAEYVRSDNFVGVAIYHSMAFGNIVSFFSNVRNWIIIVILVALVIFSYKQVRKIIKYAKEEKKEEK